MNIRAPLVAATLAVAASPTGAAASEHAAPVQSSARESGVHDFDFLIGEWRVHHRVMKKDRSGWDEFEGTSATRKVMDGAGNVEDNVLERPGGTYRAVALRAYDAKTRQWAIWWLDGRNPLGPLDPPVKGGFKDGVGDFYSDDLVDGKPIRTRYHWTYAAPDSARWEQATSADAGATWETNWTMDFRRIAHAE